MPQAVKRSASYFEGSDAAARWVLQSRLAGQALPYEDEWEYVLIAQPADSASINVFGYDAFRGQQDDVIDHVLGGGHALALAPTGSGKSLCYQVPALCLPGVTLVLSPLIALMKDQVDALNRRGVAATFINASLGRKEREARYAGLARGDYRLIYVTPERFRKADFCDALAQGFGVAAGG